MLEWQGSKERSPYLVSSSNGCMWVGHGRDVFRSAVVPAPVDDTLLTGDIVHAILAVSRDTQWGNLIPTGDIASARKFLAPSGKIDVLTNRDAPWIPKGSKLAVPSDRGHVGTRVDFPKGLYTFAYYNIATSFVFLGAW